MSLARRLAAAVALVAVIGCAPARVAPPPRPAAPAASPGPDVPDVERWVVASSGGPRTHELRLEATLHSRVDSLERTDTLQALVRTTWAFAVAPPAAPRVPGRIAGTVSAFAVAFGAQAALETPPGLRLPLLYAAEQVAVGEQPQLTLPRVDECGPAAAAVAAVRELWLAPPDTLWTGRVWADSARYTTCRDSVPLEVTSTRTFRVLGVDRRGDRTVVRITRRSVTRMSGSGTQFGEPMEVAAEGRGEMLLELALDSGAIAAGSGESELRMEMRGRRRVQELVQRTRITIAEP